MARWAKSWHTPRRNCEHLLQRGGDGGEPGIVDEVVDGSARSARRPRPPAADPRAKDGSAYARTSGDEGTSGDSKQNSRASSIVGAEVVGQQVAGLLPARAPWPAGVSAGDRHRAGRRPPSSR